MRLCTELLQENGFTQINQCVCVFYRAKTPWRIRSLLQCVYVLALPLIITKTFFINSQVVSTKSTSTKL